MLHSRRLQHLRTASIESCTKKKRVQDKRAFVCFSGSQMRTRLGEAADLKKQPAMQFVETQWLCDCAASSAVRSKWAPTSVCVDVCNLMIELSSLNRFFEKRSLPVCSSPPLTRRANPLKRTPALLSLHSYHQKFSSAKTLPCSHHLPPTKGFPKIHSPEV